MAGAHLHIETEPIIFLFLFFSMATQTTQTTAQQQAAQQKELARKLEEYIEKLDLVLDKCSKTDSYP